MNISRFIFKVVVILLFMTSMSFSESYKVIDTRSDDTLNVRTGADVSYKKIGGLAYNAKGIKVLKCKNNSKGRKWCQVRHSSIPTGWVSKRYLSVEDNCNNGIPDWLQPNGCFKEEVKPKKKLKICQDKDYGKYASAHPFTYTSSELEYNKDIYRIGTFLSDGDKIAVVNNYFENIGWIESYARRVLVSDCTEYKGKIYYRIKHPSTREGWIKARYIDEDNSCPVWLNKRTNCKQSYYNEKLRQEEQAYNEKYNSPKKPSIDKGAVLFGLGVAAIVGGVMSIDDSPSSSSSSSSYSSSSSSYDARCYSRCKSNRDNVEASCQGLNRKMNIDRLSTSSDYSDCMRKARSAYKECEYSCR